MAESLAREYENSGKHGIIFIVRGQHLAAIKENGLQLYTREGDYVARPALATDNPDHAGIFDLVFFCVKSYSLESIGRFAYDTKTSMQVDRERGKDTEMDIFTKYIIESGKSWPSPHPCIMKFTLN